jgi:hypothetical protein
MRRYTTILLFILIPLNHDSSFSVFCSALQLTIVRTAPTTVARNTTTTTTGTNTSSTDGMTKIRNIAKEDDNPQSSHSSMLPRPCSTNRMVLPLSKRRSFLTSTIMTTTTSVIANTFLWSSLSAADDHGSAGSNYNTATTTTTTVNKGNVNTNTNTIFTRGFGKEEYTNSITASRDTNISPKEVYDSIQSTYVQFPLIKAREQNRIPRAWDVGAGAGVSTQTLYNMGYEQIEAVDWSSQAWEDNVMQEKLPFGVRFTALDDERFVQNVWKKGQMEKFDVIVFNFGINERKAKVYAQEMLVEDGRLFAPVNVQSDYWLKQAFKVYDVRGNVLWSVNDVGAWSVQFQPDVTQDTCQGIWCAPFNGFQKQ